MKAPRFVQVVADGLSNVVSSIGTPKDKAANYAWTINPITRDQIDATYAHDWLSRKIVDIPPKDMTREWREWESDKKEDIYRVEREFLIQSKVKKALTLARLYGGAAILIGDGAADPEKPLDLDRFPAGGIKYLHVFSLNDLTTEGNDLITDISDPDYGLPKFYTVTPRGDNVRALGNQLKIHRSRFAIFTGVAAPESYKVSSVAGGFGWGMPVFDIIKNAVLNVNASAANAAALTEQANIDVIKDPELHLKLSDPEAESRFIRRFTLANTLKSNLNTLLLGGGEEFTRAQISFGGLPDLIRTHIDIASGAADIPIIRLFGQSPSGFSTGKEDLRNYYDMLRSTQTTDVSDQLSPLDEVVKRHVYGPNFDENEVTYQWKPLWALSEADKAGIDKLKADTTAVYISTNLFAPEELRPAVIDQLVEDGTYPTLDQHVLSEADFEELLNEQPDPAAVDPANENQPPQQNNRVAMNEGLRDAEPRTLYVRRDVTNGAAILAWARGQGLTNLVKASDLHVTIIYSKTAVDWFKMGTSYSDKLEITAGGPRQMQLMGPDDRRVLALLIPPAYDLMWRHEDFKRAGASWDWDEYQPYITISTEVPADFDMDSIEPYQGAINLGPEIFEEIETVTKDSQRADPFGDAGFGKFEENLHPRGNAGKFTNKSGGGGENSRGVGGGRHVPYWLRSKKQQQEQSIAVKHNPAVSLFDKTVEQEGIPTAKALIESLPQATRDKIKKVEADLKAGTPSYVKHYDESGRYTKERAQLHKEILQSIFTPERVRAATPAPGEKPVAVILGGRGGSGKSWLVSKDGPVDQSKFVYINPDDFKEALPEYQGWNAGLVHEESDDIHSQATEIAQRLGVNVIHDATMKTAGSTRQRVEDYKRLGYEVDAYYMFASPKTAATRAVERFEKAGRYVPPSYSLASLTNEATFDSLIPQLRNWGVYSSNDGFPPKQVAVKSQDADEADQWFRDQFEESKVHRVAAGHSTGGQFTSGGSGGGVGYVPTGPGATKFKVSKNEAQHKARVAKVLKEPPAKYGIQYRDMVSHLIKEAQHIGYHNHTGAVDSLKKKIGESFAKDANEALASGKTATAEKLFAKAKEMGFTPVIHAESANDWEKLSNEDKDNGLEHFLMIEEGQGHEASEAIANWKGLTWQQKLSYAQEAKEALSEGEPIAPAPKASTPPAASPEVHKAPSEPGTPLNHAELTPTEQIALKTDPVQVGNHGQGLVANAAVKGFNDKWAGKEIKTKEELSQKIADYGEMKQKIEAQKLAQQAEVDAMMAEAAKKAAEEHAKLYADPEVKEAYQSLEAVTKSAEHYISQAKSLLNNAGLTGVLNPVEAGHIVAYTGSHYNSLNQQLRNSAITQESRKFAQNLSAALKKLPAYKGKVYRKANLPNEIVAKYQPGMVVTERAFTSTANKPGVWSGEYHYEIESKSGREIQKLSSHPTEAEVLFDKNTDFLVVKKEGKLIYLKEL